MSNATDARRAFLGMVPIIAVVLGQGEVCMSQAGAVEGVKNVVLVHGGFVDGSGWQGVYDVLKKDGYNVAIVQNPTTSLADDVAVTKRTLAAQDGPAILVGHSYGGVVITEAGNDPKVAGLVYIAAFAPDQGESVSALIKDPPPGAPVPPILPPQDGYLYLDRTQFRASFAADVSADAAAFMADYTKQFGPQSVNPFAGYSYDAILLLQAAIPAALKAGKPGTDEFRVALRDAVEKTHELVGVSGVYTMSPTNHNGQDARAAMLVQVRDGAWKAIQ